MNEFAKWQSWSFLYCHIKNPGNSYPNSYLALKQISPSEDGFIYPVLLTSDGEAGFPNTNLLKGTLLILTISRYAVLIKGVGL